MDFDLTEKLEQKRKLESLGLYLINYEHNQETLERLSLEELEKLDKLLKNKYSRNHLFLEENIDYLIP